MPLNNSRQLGFHRLAFKAMGSPCELQLYADDSLAQRLSHEVVSLVRDLESKYSRYRHDSVTGRINAAAGSGQPISVDAETRALLEYADVLYGQSDGLFDITSGILRKAWNFKSGQLPSAEAIERLLPNIGWTMVERDGETVYLPRAGMELDFGGYVKEYTADRAADLCRDLGVRHGLINLGGDIHIIGPHPNGAPWQVGIQHPRQLTRAIATIEVTEGAVATSGDYERYLLVDGTRYCHLLNPATGWSLRPQFASASVVAARCLIAGSFSTIALLKSEDQPDWLAEAGLPYLLVDPDLNLSGSLAGHAATASTSSQPHTLVG